MSTDVWALCKYRSISCEGITRAGTHTDDSICHFCVIPRHENPMVCFSTTSPAQSLLSRPRADALLVLCSQCLLLCDGFRGKFLWYSDVCDLWYYGTLEEQVPRVPEKPAYVSWGRQPSSFMGWWPHLLAVALGLMGPTELLTCSDTSHV